MKHYEGMFILHNRDTGETEGETHVPEDVVRKMLDKVSASVIHAFVWASRKLSYPIEGNQTGTYVLTYFSAGPDAVAELARQVHLSDRCLRHLVLAIPSLPAASELPGPLAEPSSRGSRRIDGDEAETASTVHLADGEKAPKLWELLDYKNPYVLRRLVSAQGKLFSRVRSGLEAKSQRRLRREVHRARNLALLPFVGR